MVANSSNPKSKTRLARSAGLVSVVGLFSLAAPATASADFFFRPFGYAFNRPMPEPAPNVSPRAIAGILEEEGFSLVGALGRRGDQVVATGVDRRGRYKRFLIDPYEGEILRSWRIGPEVVREAPGLVEPPPAAYDAPRGPEPYAAPQTGAAEDPLVVPGLGAEPRRPAAPSPRNGTPGQTHAAARPEGAETQRIPHAPPSQATKPPARPTPPALSAAPRGSDKATEPKPAAVKPFDRKAPAQRQSGPTPPLGSAPPTAAAIPAPPIESKSPAPSQESAPNTAVHEPVAVGHQQAAPAPRTIVPAAEPAPSPPPAATPANPVSAEQSKAPSGEPPKPSPGG